MKYAEQELNMLVSCFDEASFANRELKRAVGNFIETLRADLILAGYEAPESVVKTAERVRNLIDTEYERREVEAAQRRLNDLGETS